MSTQLHKSMRCEKFCKPSLAQCNIFLVGLQCPIKQWVHTFLPSVEWYNCSCQDLKLPFNPQATTLLSSLSMKMELNFIENDFQTFDPISYLDEYFNYPTSSYGGVGVENEQFLQFFSEVAHDNDLDNSMLLDFGSGPTIYSIISLGQNVREIHMSDYLQQNLEQVRQWQQNSPQAFNWDPYLRRSLQIQSALDANVSIDESLNQSISVEQVQRLAALLRNKITVIKQGNARNNNPIGPEGKALYDVVVSSFCLEGVAKDLAEWHNLLRNLVSTIKPGGLLVFATQIEADSYRIGEGYGKIVNLSKDYIVNALLAHNFPLETIQAKELKGGPHHKEYDKFLMLAARLAP